MIDRNASTSLDTPPPRAADRARVSTPRHTSPTRLRHAWLVTLAAALAGCGTRHSDTVRHATAAQEQCCEHLVGPSRDQCLAQIVRPDDPTVADSAQAHELYSCVEDHFECDPVSGHATQPSAQAQYDCILSLSE